MSTIKGTLKHNKGRVLGVLRVRKKESNKRAKNEDFVPYPSRSSKISQNMHTSDLALSHKILLA